MATVLDFSKQMELPKSRITDMDMISGLDSFQPNAITCSGSRKNLASTQRQQTLSLYYSEPPIMCTGYEPKYGEKSSANIISDGNYTCIARIPKFSFSPNHHFYLICENDDTHKLTVFKRIIWHSGTEHYGYLYNCSYMDMITPGHKIRKGDWLRKSTSIDKHGNLCSGVNMNILYMALDQNMEDSVIISKSAADKMAVPLIKTVTVLVNENDIPVNYYGNDDVYKCMPDIGEEIKDSILLALRKEKKENALFMQSVDRLKMIIPSDDMYLLNGTVMDIDINCNNPDNLDRYCNGQFKLYYNEQKRCAREIVNAVLPHVAAGKEMEWELDVLYNESKAIVNGVQFIEKRQIANMRLEITVLEKRALHVGDKVANRYGGKGVVSKIVPTELMPRFEDDKVDVIMNSSTMVNRENPGQLFEMCLNFIASRILDRIKSGVMSLEESIHDILLFVKDVCPPQGADLEAYINSLVTDEEKAFFVDSIVRDGYIMITSEVMKDPMTIDRLNKIYQDFPYVNQIPLTVPIKDSNGNVRYVKARRNVVYGKEYVLRLKQYAEEKFSATSLSATNIRGENTKSKAARDYKLLYSNTPIRMGNMEILDLDHLGPDVVITALLLHSVSPHGRKLVEEFSIGNPYLTNIRLDDRSTNRQAEEVETYLRAIGLKLVFEKIRKKKVNPFIQYEETQLKNPFIEIPENITGEDEKLKYVAKEQKRRVDVDKKLKSGKYTNPFIEYKVVNDDEQS